MTKIYYTPTSCGAATFIAAVAAGVHVDAEQVAFAGAARTTASGVDFFTINPKGNVPTVVTNDGTVLNEGAATLQYIADLAPGKVAGNFGTTERYQVINTLNYLASEVHTSFGPLFYGLEGDAKEAQFKKIGTKLEYIEKHVLKGSHYLVGDKFSIADSYLYVILGWSAYTGFDLTAHPTFQAYREFIGALPFVVEANAKMATNPSST